MQKFYIMLDENKKLDKFHLYNINVTGDNWGTMYKNKSTVIGLGEASKLKSIFDGHIFFLVKQQMTRAWNFISNRNIKKHYKDFS